MLDLFHTLYRNEYMSIISRQNNNNTKYYLTNTDHHARNKMAAKMKRRKFMWLFVVTISILFVFLVLYLRHKLGKVSTESRAYNVCNQRQQYWNVWAVKRW